MLKSYDEKCRFYEKSPRYFGSSLVLVPWQYYNYNDMIDEDTDLCQLG